MEAWRRAKRLWTHVELHEPYISEQPREPFAYINMETRRITVHRPSLEERVGGEFMTDILAHEAGHHKLCPYDLAGLVTLMSVAAEEVGQRRAKYVENLFADLVVNTQLHRKGSRIVDTYRRLDVEGEMWSFYMSVFEEMTGERILQGPVTQAMRTDARVASRIGNRASAWPDELRRFARIANKYLDDGRAPIDEHGARDFARSPEEAGREVRRVAPSLGRKGRAVCKELLGELGVNASTADAWHYRALASRYRLSMPEVPSRAAGSRGRSPWGIGDDPSQLDVRYSMRRHGILVPGMNTYGSRGGQERATRRGVPDLLIVLDSSGSMPNPAEEESPPVTASFVAAHEALRHGARVGVVNFSVGARQQPFTRSRDAVEAALVGYRGGGTRLPSIEAMVEGRPYLLMITDAAYQGGDVAALERAASRCAGAKLFHYASDGDAAPSLRLPFQCFATSGDLKRLTLDHVRGVYQ